MFSAAALHAVRTAFEIAVANGETATRPSHLLLAFTECPGSDALAVLEALDIDSAATIEGATGLSWTARSEADTEQSDTKTSDDLQEVFTSAQVASHELEDSCIGTGHLAIGLARESGLVRGFGTLLSGRTDPEGFARAVVRQLASPGIDADRKAREVSSPIHGMQVAADRWAGREGAATDVDHLLIAAIHAMTDETRVELDLPTAKAIADRLSDQRSWSATDPTAAARLALDLAPQFGRLNGVEPGPSELVAAVCCTGPSTATALLVDLGIEPLDLVTRIVATDREHAPDRSASRTGPSALTREAGRLLQALSVGESRDVLTAALESGFDLPPRVSEGLVAEIAGRILTDVCANRRRIGWSAYVAGMLANEKGVDVDEDLIVVGLVLGGVKWATELAGRRWLLLEFLVRRFQGLGLPGDEVDRWLGIEGPPDARESPVFSSDVINSLADGEPHPAGPRHRPDDPRWLVIDLLLATLDELDRTVERPLRAELLQSAIDLVVGLREDELTTPVNQAVQRLRRRYEPITPTERRRYRTKDRCIESIRVVREFRRQVGPVGKYNEYAQEIVIRLLRKGQLLAAVRETMGGMRSRELMPRSHDDNLWGAFTANVKTAVVSGLVATVLFLLLGYGAVASIILGFAVLAAIRGVLRLGFVVLVAAVIFLQAVTWRTGLVLVPALILLWFTAVVSSANRFGNMRASSYERRITTWLRRAWMGRDLSNRRTDQAWLGAKIDELVAGPSSVERAQLFRVIDAYGELQGPGALEVVLTEIESADPSERYQAELMARLIPALDRIGAIDRARDRLDRLTDEAFALLEPPHQLRVVVTGLRLSDAPLWRTRLLLVSGNRSTSGALVSKVLMSRELVALGRYDDAVELWRWNTGGGIQGLGLVDSLSAATASEWELDEMDRVRLRSQVDAGEFTSVLRSIGNDVLHDVASDDVLASIEYVDLRAAAYEAAGSTEASAALRLWLADRILDERDTLYDSSGHLENWLEVVEQFFDALIRSLVALDRLELAAMIHRRFPTTMGLEWSDPATTRAEDLFCGEIDGTLRIAYWHDGDLVRFVTVEAPLVQLIEEELSALLPVRGGVTASVSRTMDSPFRNHGLSDRFFRWLARAVLGPDLEVDLAAAVDVDRPALGLHLFGVGALLPWSLMILDDQPLIDRRTLTWIGGSGREAIAPQHGSDVRLVLSTRFTHLGAVAAESSIEVVGHAGELEVEDLELLLVETAAEGASFCFVGHARPGSRYDQDRGGLVLADNRLLTSRQILRTRAACPRLVFLLGCQSSGERGATSWQGLPAALLRRGSTRVVGAAWRLGDTAENAAFFRALIAQTAGHVEPVEGVNETIRSGYNHWRATGDGAMPLTLGALNVYA